MREPIRFILNNDPVETDLPPGTPALDFIRSTVGLTGTKEACREGDCGACAVLLGEPAGAFVRYRTVASCLLPVAELSGRHVVTIEGLNQHGLTPIQQAIVDHGATQCGFCTPGIVVALTGFLLGAARLDERAGVTAIAGNLCRCTGYRSLSRVVDELCARFAGELGNPEVRLDRLIEAGLAPAYFAGVPALLEGLRAPRQPERPRAADMVICGGTDLYVQRPEELREADLFMLSRSGRSGLWIDDDNRVCIGAATDLEALRSSSLATDTIPGLDGFIELICSQPIRHRASLGGNAVNASPIGDTTIMLLALDADMGLSSNGAGRVIPLRTFFTGYKQLDLGEDEIIEWFRFAAPSPHTRFNFEKVCKRRHLDIASVNSAMSITVDGDRIADVHLSAGGVAPIPLYLAETRRFLLGSRIDADTARQAARVAVSEISPISDVRGSAEYKRLLLRQLVLAHFCVLFEMEDVVA